MNRQAWKQGAWAVAAVAGLGILVVQQERSAGAKGGVAGKVSFLKGSAQHGESEKGPFKPLKRNDDVKEGDFLKTGADAKLEMKLADGSLVRLGADSAMKLGLAKVDAEKEGEASQSKLTAGKMWASVTKAVGGETKFAVRTENAVAGVRGTTFRVNADEDGSTVVKVYEGAVAVSNAPVVEKSKAGGGKKGPVDFKGRKEVAAPFQEVTMEQWEKIVGQMMSIKVGANGSQADPEKFTAESDGKDKADKEWVAWNQEQDQKKGAK